MGQLLVDREGLGGIVTYIVYVCWLGLLLRKKKSFPLSLQIHRAEAQEREPQPQTSPHVWEMRAHRIPCYYCTILDSVQYI